MTFQELNGYKHPGEMKVRVTFFWASNITNDIMPALSEKAEMMLKEHGLGLDVYPARARTEAHVIRFQETIYLREHAEQLRMACHQIYQDTRPRLPVICCQGSGALHARGQTFMNLGGWLPFVLIYCNEPAPDRVTLLHEIGHAANSRDSETDRPNGGPMANFMNYHGDRTLMTKPQVIKIATSYFTK